jgi:hypothetical protein
MGQQTFHSEAIAHRPKTTNYTHSPISEIGAMTKTLTGMGIAEMQLHVWNSRSK